ncbi:MAG: UDP-N-acetylmuramate--L-alanine ligase [Anaerolineae bacterium]|nr:UDP-N-acetylmuramate--L-alanine ligase [Chloroflexota bacterium]
MNRQPKAGLPHHIHLVGIGGIGLSAIARVLLARGYAVSGSDMRASRLTDEMARLGARVTIGHQPAAVAEAQMVVVSSAVPEENPEIIAARAAGIPVLDRRAFLGRLLEGNRTIAVAGTHGKTSTTGMIVAVLRAAGMDPGYIVGGILQDTGANAASGTSEWFVIEADEYARMFHGLSPEIAVVTVIEMDHPDCFADIDAMREAYSGFVDRVVPGGLLIACSDGPQVRLLLQERQGTPETVTYGQAAGADCVLSSVTANERGGVDFILTRGTHELAHCSIALPGVHNALNATAALIVADRCGIPLDVACEALRDFRGVRRRFELKGEAGGVTVIDDYGHHPTEIAATLAAARLRYPGRRVWAVVQPHTFSRLQALWDSFRTCLADADEVIITDVYAARSREVHGSSDAASLVAAIDHPSARHIGGLAEAETYLCANLRSGDVLITLGAGDGYLIGERILVALEDGCHA